MSSELLSYNCSTYSLAWKINAAGDVAGLQQQSDPYLDFNPDALGQQRKIRS